MEILLTGAGGFCGGFLTSHFIDRGITVHAVTRRSSVIEPSISEARARLQVINSKLDETVGFPDRIDAVVHTAASSPMVGVTAENMILDNVMATRNLVDYALRARARLFVLFSSLSVYGDVSAPVLDETAPIVNPGIYGVTKLLAEKLLEEHAEVLPSVVLRLPGIVGPGSRRNWLSVTYEKLRAGEPVSYFNPNAEFNNAVHVADLADLVTGQFERSHDGQIVANLGAAGSMKVRDIIALLSGACSSTSALSVCQNAQSSFVIDYRKAEERLGYRPSPIQEVLKSFAAENR